MSTVSTSGPITPGQRVVMNAPAAAPSLQLAAVMLQNLSGYQLALNVGPDQFVIPPYVSDVFTLPPAAAAAITFTPSDTQGSPAGVPSYVNASWLGADEVPDPASYPAMIPAPAFALGLAIAQELLAQGVPSVLITDIIFSGGMAAGAVQTLDVSGYASAVIIASQFTSSSTLAYSQLTVAGGSTVDVGETLPIVTVRGSRARIKLTGGALKLTNTAANPEAMVVTVIGSNRVQNERFDVRAKAGLVDEWNVGSAALGAGSVTPLVQVDNTIKLQGRCSVRFRLSGGTLARGFLFLSDAVGNQWTFADTGEPEMFTGAAGFLSLKSVDLPPGYNGVSFQCTTAGTTSVNATIVEST